MTTDPPAADVDEATSWVRSFVPIDGPLQLAQTEPWATVYRASAGGELVWFKVCAPHLAFEVPLTAGLSVRHDVTTEVIAHDAGRRWLLMADAGASLGTLGNPPERWLAVLPAYAELQIRELERAAEHLAIGVPDLRLERLPALADDLVRADLPLEASERSALEAVVAHLPQRCDELAAAGIGPSVQHDDLHMWNVHLRDGTLRVLDWGDASIGHPFWSLLETFRFLEEANGLAPEDAWYARLRDAYLEPWGGDRRAAFDLAMRVSGIAHAVAWLHQRAALPEAERPDFDPSFAHILRLALRRARAT